MKSIQAIVATLTLVPAAAWSAPRAFESLDAETLVPGEVVSIDVTYREATIPLRLSVPLDPSLPVEVPKARVVESYGDFECSVAEPELVSSEDQAADQGALLFEIAVTWSPGTDSSGCRVEVLAKGLQPAVAHVYMSY
jgi:hypothetical protein